MHSQGEKHPVSAQDLTLKHAMCSVYTHLPRDDACSSCSAPQDKGELADLGQPCRDDPLDVLTALWQDKRQDQSCQHKLQEWFITHCTRHRKENLNGRH
jgi:hypothetical protein